MNLCFRECTCCCDLLACILLYMGLRLKVKSVSILLTSECRTVEYACKLGAALPSKRPTNDGSSLLSSAGAVGYVTYNTGRGCVTWHEPPAKRHVYLIMHLIISFHADA